MDNGLFDSKMILAAEDFLDEDFEKFHFFSNYEKKIIKKLISHGPVLLRGGRGSGKSAILRKAYLTLKQERYNAIGIYISLRYLPLLRSEDVEYENYFARILSKNIKENIDSEFEITSDIFSLQEQLNYLSQKHRKRIILYFDDAAHIGREGSLKEFFDIFRTLSNNVISCKATIYPGVTEFGKRFDLLNDANVIDIARNDEYNYFEEFFYEIIALRYPEIIKNFKFSSFSVQQFSKFMGKAVVGNVRAFIYSMNHVIEEIGEKNISYNEIDETLKYLASEYYWPLLEELEPKLGKYQPLVEPTRNLADLLYKYVASSIDKPDYGVSLLIHKDNVNKYKKIYEILEYAGFIVKKETSKAMKGGGRGSRFSVNLCNLLEVIPNSRLTKDLFFKWLMIEKEYVQIRFKSDIDKIIIPSLQDGIELSILSEDISKLKISNAYPYGLTDHKIETLKNAGYNNVKDLIEADKMDFAKLPGISNGWANRINSVAGQAIWM